MFWTIVKWHIIVCVVVMCIYVLMGVRTWQRKLERLSELNKRVIVLLEISRRRSLAYDEALELEEIRNELMELTA